MRLFWLIPMLLIGVVGASEEVTIVYNNTTIGTASIGDVLGEPTCWVHLDNSTAEDIVWTVSFLAYNYAARTDKDFEIYIHNKYDDYIARAKIEHGWFMKYKDGLFNDTYLTGKILNSINIIGTPYKDDYGNLYFR